MEIHELTLIESVGDDVDVPCSSSEAAKRFKLQTLRTWITSITDGIYDVLGAASTAVSSHSADSDPHSAAYFNQTRGDARYMLKTPTGSVKTDNYTLATTDAAGVIVVNAATTKTITVSNALTNMSDYTTFEIVQRGAGKVVIAGSGSQTVYGANGTRTKAQYSVAFVTKIESGVWIVDGNVEVNS